MSITDVSSSDVYRVMDLASDYLAADGTDIPDWYAECVLALYNPSLAPNLSETRELLREGDKDNLLAILFLCSVMNTAEIDRLRKRGWATFLAAMFTVWNEFSRNNIYTICSKCRYFPICRFPRHTYLLNRGQLENPAPIIEAFNDLLRGAGIPKGELERRLVDVKKCLLLKKKPKDKDTHSMLTEGGKSALEVLNAVLDQEEDKGEKNRKTDPSELNARDIPRLGDTKLLTHSATAARHAQQIKQKAGVSSMFLNPDGEESSKVAFDETDRMEDKILDPHTMLLPDELFEREILSGDPIYTLRPAHYSKTPINLEVFVDFSTSMVENDTMLPAIGAVCAFLDVFGPYGRVKVTPFSTEPLEDIMCEVDFEEKASSTWLAKLIKGSVDKEGTTTAISAGFGGTQIQEVLLGSFSSLGMAMSGRVNYMVLITDAEDYVVDKLDYYFTERGLEGVSLNTILISPIPKLMERRPLGMILKEHTLLQTITPEEFKDAAPQLLKKIAMNYRESR